MTQRRIELIPGYYFEQSETGELPDWHLITPNRLKWREWWCEEAEARAFADALKAYIEKERAQRVEKPL